MTGQSSGLLESLTRVAATLMTMAHTRLELLAIDLDEGRTHLLSLLCRIFAASFAFGLAVVLATLALVLAFDASQRLLVLTITAGCYFGIGATIAIFTLRAARSSPRPFATTLSVLSKDRQQLLLRS